MSVPWKARFVFLSFAWIGLAANANAANFAGFVHSANFDVFTPAGPSADVLAKDILQKAEQLRREIALAWLGEELPPSSGQTIINVRFDDEANRGLTWAKDRPERKYHELHLVVSAELAIDDLLAHEMVHVVLATRFSHPNRLPAWLEEGIASRYDNQQRQAIRARLAQWFATTGNRPRLMTVLSADNIATDDQEAYAAATTLTDMLLSRGDKQTLIRFGQLIGQVSLDRALNECYGIQDAVQLESLWHTWVAKNNVRR